MAIDKTRFRKTVVGPVTGQSFVIRRINVAEYMKTIGDLPIAADADLARQIQAMQSALEKKVGDPATEEATQKFFLERGVVEPKIFFGAEKDCPDDMIPEADLASDGNFLAAQIAEFSFEMRGIKEMSFFFPESRTADSGPGSEEVRGAAIEASANGHDIKTA